MTMERRRQEMSSEGRPRQRCRDGVKIWLVKADQDNDVETASRVIS